MTILITKTSDQTRQRGPTLSTCKILEPRVPCAPPYPSLLLSRLSELAATGPTLSFLHFFLSTQVSPVSHLASATNVCVRVYIELHITAQSGPVILVILCHSHCVCVCVFVILYILDVRLVDPASVQQEEGHTGFLLRPSAVFNHPFPSSSVKSHFLYPSFSTCWACFFCFFFFFFCE